ncbi:aspartate/glutamate racemase family protein [Roseobacter sp. YSTF-M11]|uniref:Aspartate/glutamate racemase family protein n=1 Tax=Roseobacter insulae TaxID=2859783 RepID=A0A9X1K294_9RHOB|nr:aspartate/glutamate racemase family protein [Roseobacter insulae]MBW4710009.1 aspartate/glutamate racemase family protein [Roseobacter insulae]
MTPAHAYTMTQTTPPQIGLVVLQSDETLEDDMRRLIPHSVRLLVTRLPSAREVTSETLARMEHHLSDAAALFPRNLAFDAVGYGCTSGTAQIGVERIATCVRDGTRTAAVTEPVSALLAACAALGAKRIALLSPYIESVSDTLRRVLADNGIDAPVLGTFAEAEEAKVARIDGPSIHAAALQTLENAQADALFLSCTNLRTLDVVPDLERAAGIPVISSNLVLGWHLLQCAGVIGADVLPGDLLKGA